MEKHINEIEAAKDNFVTSSKNPPLLKLVCSTRFFDALRRWAEEQPMFVTTPPNGEPPKILGMYIDARHPALLPPWAPAVCRMDENLYTRVSDLVVDRLQEVADQIKKFGPHRAPENVTTAALIVDGMRDDLVGDLADALSTAGLPAGRFFAGAVAYAMHLVRARELFEKVVPHACISEWHYNVVEAFGQWYATTFIVTRLEPAHDTCLAKIAELGLACYNKPEV